MADHPNPTGRRVEVRILGPVDVVGGAGPVRRSCELELVAYLACHPEGASCDAWPTVVWPDRPVARATANAAVSGARRVLGAGPTGEPLLERPVRGWLRLAPAVGCDWDRFRGLAAVDDPASWDAALALVRGRPFDRMRGGDWAVFEGLAAEIEIAVADTVARAVAWHRARGDRVRAAAALGVGLRAAPFDEGLVRLAGFGGAVGRCRAGEEDGAPARADPAEPRGRRGGRPRGTGSRARGHGGPPAGRGAGPEVARL